MKINFNTFQAYIFQGHKTIYKVDFVFRKLLMLLSTKNHIFGVLDILNDISGVNNSSKFA